MNKSITNTTMIQFIESVKNGTVSFKTDTFIENLEELISDNKDIQERIDTKIMERQEFINSCESQNMSDIIKAHNMNALIMQEKIDYDCNQEIIDFLTEIKSINDKNLN